MAIIDFTAQMASIGLGLVILLTVAALGVIGELDRRELSNVWHQLRQAVPWPDGGASVSMAAVTLRRPRPVAFARREEAREKSRLVLSVWLSSRLHRV